MGLEKIAAMPLNTWQYRNQEAKYRHMGPMAQDFYGAFGLGESDKQIDAVDADGVALAAVQGLNAKLAQKDLALSARLDAKDREIAALQRRLAAQDETLAVLGRQFAEMHTQLQALQANPQSRIVRGDYPRRRRGGMIVSVSATP